MRYLQDVIDGEIMTYTELHDTLVDQNTSPSKLYSNTDLNFSVKSFLENSNFFKMGPLPPYPLFISVRIPQLIFINNRKYLL